MAKKYSTKTYNFTGNVQEINISNIDEIYIELYGAKGKDSSAGRGGKASGVYVNNNNLDKLYLYVGGNNGWNGGGSGTHNGGGATDIRTVKASEGSWYDTSHTSWDTDKSLLSRIAVAGGGGGKEHVYNDAPGHGGGLKGNGKGGTQTSGGKGGNRPGGFGYGGNGNGAGGGGWYGGGSAPYNYGYAGGGGSSYIALLKNGNTVTGGNSSSANGFAYIKFPSYGFLFISKGSYYSNNNGEIIKIDNPNSDISYIDNGCDININDYIDKLKTFGKFKIRKIKE